jgi:hypothetical protein
MERVSSTELMVPKLFWVNTKIIKGMEKEYNIRLMELLKKKDNGKIINLLNDLSPIINL